jgi:hypothetical protein
MDYHYEMNELFIERNEGNVILLKFRQNGKYETPIAVSPRHLSQVRSDSLGYISGDKEKPMIGGS